jgi:hypothetical protein
MVKLTLDGQSSLSSSSHHHIITRHIIIPVTTPLMVKGLLLMRKPACGERARSLNQVQKKIGGCGGRERQREKAIKK